MSDDLAKMGAACVRRTSYFGRDCIEKRAVSIVEFQFYHQVAPVFRASGIAVPELVASDAATQTLTLEYIPHSITQSDLVERSGVLSMISRIHHHPIDEHWHFKRHSWPHENTEMAINLLCLSDNSAEIIRDVEKCSSSLFDSNTLISGDTNAGNWGIRDQGDVVLYDWERFSTGNPAIDLAPLIKGMGNISDFISISNKYQLYSSSFDASTLAQEIAICKLWVVTEVITILANNNKPDLNHYLNWYRSNLPAWLNELREFLKR